MYIYNTKGQTRSDPTSMRHLELTHSQRKKEQIEVTRGQEEAKWGGGCNGTRVSVEEMDETFWKWMDGGGCTTS